MPMYNGEVYLQEAVDSILAQDFQDFEFLVIDDGSTDGSMDLINGYDDARITLLRNDRNLGVAATLNRGLETARGRFVARMDCDDIAFPHRLRMQVHFMDAHPRVAVCGTWVEAFGDGLTQVWRFPEAHNDIVCGLIFESLLAHPSVMLRKAAVDQAGLRYDPAVAHAEDYDLWVRCGRVRELANIPAVLLRRRTHEAAVGLRHTSVQTNSADRVRRTQLRWLGVEPSDEEMALHRSLSLRQYEMSPGYADRVDTWLCRLLEANARCGVYQNESLFSTLATRWREVCRHLAPLGLWAYGRYRRSSLAAGTGGLGSRTKLLIRAGLRLAP